jgi:repressor LexA
MNELTDRQNQILSFIEEYRQENGVPPTYREIQAQFGFSSPKAVLDHVKAIIKKGYAAVRKGSRGIVSLRPSGGEIPLLGTIAAGVPIEAIENVEAKLDLFSLGINNSKRDYFALRVQGESMINAHIMDGDVVVIQKQPMANSNDIAAVLWNGNATLKYVRPSGRSILLVPANDAMEPIVVTEDMTDNFSILGKVVRVIRGI